MSDKKSDSIFFVLLSWYKRTKKSILDWRRSAKISYRPIHEKSDKQSLSNDKRFSVSLTPRIFLHPLFANRDEKKNELSIGNRTSKNILMLNIKNSLSPILRYTEIAMYLDLSVSRLRSIHLKGIERSREATAHNYFCL